MAKLLLHLEGLTVLIASIILYGYYNFNWLLFILFFFAPDISMFGYLINKHIGAIIYNIVHTYITPAVVIAIGFFLSANIIVASGIIWIAHIGMDRMFGYGLKYPTNFKDTHLGRV